MATERQRNWALGLMLSALVFGAVGAGIYHSGVDSGYQHGWDDGYGAGRTAGVNAQGDLERRLSGLGICPWARAMVASGLCAWDKPPGSK